MAKIFDRILIALFSLASIVALVTFILAAFGAVPLEEAQNAVYRVYHDTKSAVTFIIVSVILLLIGIRMFYIAIRPSRTDVPGVYLRSDYGGIRISLDTFENLALKAASRFRGVHDLKARVKVGHDHLEIELRAIVDGDVSIPSLTEEMQSAVKTHVEEITGVPVADVSVYVANVMKNTNTFKSRVE